jgi:hypothetical protein
MYCIEVDPRKLHGIKELVQNEAKLPEVLREAGKKVRKQAIKQKASRLSSEALFVSSSPGLSMCVFVCFCVHVNVYVWVWVCVWVWVYVGVHSFACPNLTSLCRDLCRSLSTALLVTTARLQFIPTPSHTPTEGGSGGGDLSHSSSVHRRRSVIPPKTPSSSDVLFQSNSSDGVVDLSGVSVTPEHTFGHDLSGENSPNTKNSRHAHHRPSRLSSSSTDKDEILHPHGDTGLSATTHKKRMDFVRRRSTSLNQVTDTLQSRRGM